MAEASVKEYAEAVAKLRGIMQRMDDMQRRLTEVAEDDWACVVPMSPTFQVPSRLMGATAFNPQEWPTGEQIAELLIAFHHAVDDVDRIRNSVGPELAKELAGGLALWESP